MLYFLVILTTLLGNGKAVSYGLDTLDRVDNILVPNVLSRTYGYDKSHNLTSRKDNLTQTASAIKYDKAGRLAYETSGNHLVKIDYRPDQSIKSITKNGVTRTIGIDARHRPTTGFDGEAFGYDGFGNINAMTGGKAPQAFAFFSDSTLVSAGTQHNAYRASFVTPRTADALLPPNYIALSGKFPQPLTYPQNIGAQRLASHRMFYFYDADNQRTVRSDEVNKTREFMIYGSEGLLAEYDDTQQPQVEYIRLGGKVIAQRGKATANGCTKWLFCDSFEGGGGISGGASSGNVTYLHNDILGTPVAATDKSGNLKWRSDRMAFGMVENPQSEPSRTKFPIGYTGHEFDAETGLTYAQARYYRRDSGAFISPDPITFRSSNMTSINRYVYGANNPYKYVDPTGKLELHINVYKPKHDNPHTRVNVRFTAPKFFVDTQTQDRVSDMVAKQLAKKAAGGFAGQLLSWTDKATHLADRLFGFDVLPVQGFAEIDRKTRNAIDTQLLENALSIWKEMSNVERTITENLLGTREIFDIHFKDIGNFYKFIDTWHDMNPSAFTLNFGDKTEFKNEIDKTTGIILESLRGL